MADSRISKQYLVYDGVLVSPDVPLLTSTNRAFRYGDGLFETIRFHKGAPLYWEAHYQRLLKGMAVLQMATGSFPSRQKVRDSIIDLVVKNRIFADARVRLTVFRKGEGLYTPDKMQVSWLIEATNLGQTGYSFPEKGLKVEIYKDFPKLFSPVSPYKTVASLPYVMAGIYCKENNLDDCLVVNGQGKLIESFNSSLFWVKENVVYTPLVSTGCIDGVIRKIVLDVVRQLGFKMVESMGATENDILQADEVFLTNTISGIRWVAAFREQRYFAQVSQKIFRAMLA